ncbi:MAG: acyl-CoA thioesterase [Lachnospiraceae bacterium]|nr:acyl-CoA thioesterase [Lachnospiraceae bacterium]
MEGNFTVYNRKINYYETDKMAIVHHSNYIRFFEEARLDMMDQFDLNYRKMEDMGIIIPVMSVDCKYIVPLCFDDEVQIHTKIVKFDGIKMEIAYEIYRDDVLCTTGHSGHCFLDKDMKPFRMKRLYPDLYNKLKSLTACD